MQQNFRKSREIKARCVLLIDASGTNVGVVETVDAYQKADSAGLDLIQVSEGKNGIPVCKIADRGKMKYEQAKKKKAAKAAQQVTKEIKMRPNTSDHDLEYRANQASEFLTDGDRVKIVVRFRGRERNHMTETGRGTLERFLAMIDASVYKIEKAADVGERDISITLVPDRK